MGGSLGLELGLHFGLEPFGFEPLLFEPFGLEPLQRPQPNQ